MSELSYPCVSCQTVAMDEYHWFQDVDGEQHKVVWHLCEDHCEFACDVVELIANLEEEVEAWKSI